MVMTRSHPLFVPTVTNTCQDMIAEETLYTVEIHTSVNTLKNVKIDPPILLLVMYSKGSKSA